MLEPDPSFPEPDRPSESTKPGKLYRSPGIAAPTKSRSPEFKAIDASISVISAIENPDRARFQPGDRPEATHSSSLEVSERDLFGKSVALGKGRTAFGESLW